MCRGRLPDRDICLLSSERVRADLTAVRAAADDGPTRRASIQNRRRVAESIGPPVSTWPATLNAAVLERRPSGRAGRPLRGGEVSESCLHRSAGRVLRKYPVDQVDVHGATTGWLGQTNARMPLLRARSRSFCAWLGALKMRLHEKFWHAEMLEHIAAKLQEPLGLQHGPGADGCGTLGWVAICR